jgi:hypothetical protein
MGFLVLCGKGLCLVNMLSDVSKELAMVAGFTSSFLQAVIVVITAIENVMKIFEIFFIALFV